MSVSILSQNVYINQWGNANLYVYTLILDILKFSTQKIIGRNV